MRVYGFFTRSLGLLAVVPVAVCFAQVQRSSSDANDFVNLVRTYQGKAFCPPHTATIKDALGVVADYVRSHPELQGRYSDQQALHALATAYPCRIDPSSALSGAVGKRVNVQPTGVYATIDTKPDIATVRAVRFGSATEASDAAMRVTRNPGAYSPAVLFALSEWYYKRGDIEEAIFWLNAASLRGRFDASICTDSSAKSAVAELSQLVPLDIYRQQFQDFSRIRKVIDKIVAWDTQTPATYDHRWISLHGLKAMNTGLGTEKFDGPLTVPTSLWGQIAEDNRAQYRTEMLQHLEVEKSAMK